MQKYEKKWKYNYGLMMKKNTSRFGKCFVVLPGFEPGQAEPKSDVLPLHHRTIHCMRKSAAKVLLFCRVDKFFLPVWVVVVFKNLTMCLLWLFNFLRSVVALWVGRWCGTVRKIQISCCYVCL